MYFLFECPMRSELWCGFSVRVKSFMIIKGEVYCRFSSCYKTVESFMTFLFPNLHSLVLSDKRHIIMQIL